MLQKEEKAGPSLADAGGLPPGRHSGHRSALSPGSGPWDLPSFELPLLPQFLGVAGYPGAEHGPRSSPFTLKVGAQVPFLDLFG